MNGRTLMTTRLCRVCGRNIRRPARHGLCGGLCARSSCNRVWLKMTAVTTALAPSDAPWRLRYVESTTGLPRRDLNRALVALERRGYVQTVRVSSGSDDVPDWNGYRLTDEGRAHFLLPLPVSDHTG